MKKILLTLCFSAFILVSFAQSSKSDDYYQGIEHYDNLRLSKDQKLRIKKLNQEMGRRFQAIGKDRSLTGYEKGQRKRELAIKKREAIHKILSESQRETWKNEYSEKYPNYKYKQYDSISDKYDDLLDRLEDKYESDKKSIERDPRLSKAERKSKKEALKRTYKAEKERLKNEEKIAKGKF